MMGRSTADAKPTGEGGMRSPNKQPSKRPRVCAPEEAVKVERPCRGHVAVAGGAGSNGDSPRDWGKTSESFDLLNATTYASRDRGCNPKAGKRSVQRSKNNAPRPNEDGRL